jgi:NAD(P)-dependent dehydrogenase (short-subunit alcohol dehydrogenase family)
MPAAPDASTLLRPGTLDGVHMLVASAAPSEPTAATDERDRFADAVATTCVGAGARVSAWRPPDAVPADADRLVVDAASLFAAAAPGERRDDDGGGGARDALRDCLDGAWGATRAVATEAFIDRGRPGRMVYVAPAAASERSRDGTHAGAAQAGLENLARTLSIEWARFSVTLVTIVPGERTTPGDVAAVTAFLASPAGAYYSGCLLDMRGVAAMPAAEGSRPLA